VGFFKYTIFVKNNNMAEKKFFVDVNLQGNNINNLKADTLDITTNLASANTKRIVYWSGQYYYSDGTSWIALSGGSGNLPAGGATGDILAKASGTDYDVEWISNYTSTVQHEVKAGVALSKGQAVYVSSAAGANMIVSKASNASEATSSKTMGLVASSAALNDIIFVITEGLLTGTGGAPLDTSSATEGDPVWLGTNGNLLFGLANKPVAPAHLVFLGIVTRVSSTVGEIFVKVQNGFELGELHNVDALNPSNNDGLFYNTTSSLWEHKSITTALGYTPENQANKSTSTSLGTSDTLYPTQNAVKVYADNLLGNANALVYKGTIDCSTNPDYPTADAGWMYIASVAGKIGGASGTDAEVGDMIICNTDGTVSGNQATVGQYWNVIQKNIVGAVTGPASSVNNTVAVFDGTTGKVIKQGIITDNGTKVGIGTATPSAKLDVNGDIKISTIANATTDTDKFIVSDSGVIKYRTGTQVLSDIGAVSGSGTTDYISKFTAGGTIGNSIIQDDGSKVGINIAPQTGTILSVAAGVETAITATTSTVAKNAVYGSNIGDSAGNRAAAFFEAYPSDTPTVTNIYVAGRFYADGPFAYAVQLQDNSEGIGKFLKCITSAGQANWATMSVADTGLTLTTTGTNGAATLVGNTLNIPTYEGSLIPKMSGNEIWRGSTFRNNSTTTDTTGGLTFVTPTGTATARSVATTSYATRSIRMGVVSSSTTVGRYTGIRGSVLLWYVTGGFLYTGEFNISDTAFVTGTHNFWGLASSTSDLLIGGVNNDQPSALTNIIAFANDSGDANLQIMHNDASGTATKTDLGASFPSNRTAGAAITTIYSCYLYNAPASSNVIYRIVNKETGAVAQGTLSTNLPASTVGLNFFGARTMGTPLGGVNNSGQFDVYRLGVYSL
jgi:hypothetical protein